MESNAVEVHIHNLRRKLDPRVIRTVRGVGYRLGMPLEWVQLRWRGATRVARAVRIGSGRRAGASVADELQLPLVRPCCGMACAVRIAANKSSGSGTRRNCAGVSFTSCSPILQGGGLACVGFCWAAGALPGHTILHRSRGRACDRGVSTTVLGQGHHHPAMRRHSAFLPHLPSADDAFVGVRTRQPGITRSRFDARLFGAFPPRVDVRDFRPILSVPTSSQSRSLSISTPVTTTTWKKLSQLPATQMGLGYDKNRFKS